MTSEVPRHRPKPGMILPETDPRVQAVMRAFPFGQPRFREEYQASAADAAEIVNAVLEADDSIDHAAMMLQASQIDPRET